jgi:hypothetical protein
MTGLNVLMQRHNLFPLMEARFFQDLQQVQVDDAYRVYLADAQGKSWDPGSRHMMLIFVVGLGDATTTVRRCMRNEAQNTAPVVHLATKQLVSVQEVLWHVVVSLAPCSACVPGVLEVLADPSMRVWASARRTELQAVACSELLKQVEFPEVEVGHRQPALGGCAIL